MHIYQPLLVILLNLILNKHWLHYLNIDTIKIGEILVIGLEFKTEININQKQK